MPNYEVHKRIGMFASLIFSVLFIIFVYKKIPITLGKSLFIPLVVIVYSNFPDYDFPLGRLRKATLKFIFTVMALSAIASIFISIKLLVFILTVAGILGIGMLKLKHRGVLHTYWMALLASLPLLYIHWFLAVLGFICASMHILVDRIFSKLKRLFKRR